MQKTENKRSLISFLIIIFTIIIFSVAFIAVRLCSVYMDRHFANYAQHSAEKLSFQVSELISEINDDNIPVVLDAVAKTTIHNDKNIMSVEFADENGNIFIKEEH